MHRDQSIVSKNNPSSSSLDVEVAGVIVAHRPGSDLPIFVLNLKQQYYSSIVLRPVDISMTYSYSYIQYTYCKSTDSIVFESRLQSQIRPGGRNHVLDPCLTRLKLGDPFLLLSNPSIGRPILKPNTNICISIVNLLTYKPPASSHHHSSHHFTRMLSRYPIRYLLSIPLLLLLQVLFIKDSYAAMTTTVENFRPVNGLSRVYRCAKTEPLATVSSPNTDAECLILQQTGLVLDLRSDAERDDLQAKQWMERFGFQAFDAAAGDDIPLSPLSEKRVLRIDVQPRQRIYDYMTSCWLTPVQRAMTPMLSLVDPNKLQEIQLDALNARGLAGLNEAILESGGADLCLALQEMTKHLENSDTSVVFHCVKGKDR